MCSRWRRRCRRSGAPCGLWGGEGAGGLAWLLCCWFLLRCAAFGRGLRAGLHDASAVDSSSSVVPFLVGLGGGLFYGRFLLGYRASSLAGFLL